MEHHGKTHIMIKAGSVIEVGECHDPDSGKLVNVQYVLDEDICVYVENDPFKVTPHKVDFSV